MNFKINYVAIPCIVFGVLMSGYFFTQPGMSWYATLELSSLTPPRWVFPLVWNTLGVFTAIAVVLFYNNCSKKSLYGTILGLFIANGFLNVLWSATFFRWHYIGYAWWVALALEFTLLALIFLLLKRERKAAFLLMPYAVWIIFALYLNAQTWLLN